MSLFSLEGKVALITGGTRGIGSGMAIGLAEAGADIVLVQRSYNSETKDAIEALGRKAWIVTADLADRVQVKSIVKRALDVAPKLDILLNCAGIQRRYPAAEFPDEEWDAVIEVNLTSCFILCRDIGAYFLTKEKDEHGQRGKIINVGSLMCFQGGITVPAYTASKGGIGQMTKAFSNEWISQGICVNCIAPGYVDTEMNTALIANPTRSKQILERIPAGRWGNPDDFKGPATFLASNASNYVSGDILLVDGGWMGR